MRIAIMGTGGVGGYFGGLLAQAGEDVTFIARGRHLEAIQSDGLRVKSAHGDFHVQSSPLSGLRKIIAVRSKLRTSFPS